MQVELAITTDMSNIEEEKLDRGKDSASELDAEMLDRETDEEEKGETNLHDDLTAQQSSESTAKLKKRKLALSIMEKANRKGQTII